MLLLCKLVKLLFIVRLFLAESFAMEVVILWFVLLLLFSYSFYSQISGLLRLGESSLGTLLLSDSGSDYY